MMGQPHTSPSIPPKVLWPVLIVVILGIAVGGFFLLNSYIYNEKQGDDTDTVAVTNQVDENTNQNVNSNLDDWQTYTNEELGFSLKYPIDWTAETVESDDVMDHRVGDAIISNGSCESSACNISSSFCEFTISSAISELNDSISDPVQWIMDQGFYKGDQIEESEYNGLSAWTTKVAVIATAQDGSQGMGKYVLIYDSTSGKYYSAYLSKGFSLTSCEVEMDEILDTISFSSSTIDTSDWQTYTNEEYGYTAKYPNSWTVEEKNILEDPYKEGRPGPFRSIDFRSADQEHLLNVYLKKSSDVGTSLLGGGIGAGDFVKIDNIDVAGYSVPAIHNIYQGKVKTLFTPDAGAITSIGDYDFGAQFADLSGDYDETDLLKETEYYQALSILKSISL